MRTATQGRLIFRCSISAPRQLSRPRNPDFVGLSIQSAMSIMGATQKRHGLFLLFFAVSAGTYRTPKSVLFPFFSVYFGLFPTYKSYRSRTEMVV